MFRIKQTFMHRWFVWENIRVSIFPAKLIMCENKMILLFYFAALFFIMCRIALKTFGMVFEFGRIFVIVHIDDTWIGAM